MVWALKSRSRWLKVVSHGRWVWRLSTKSVWTYWIHKSVLDPKVSMDLLDPKVRMNQLDPKQSVWIYWIQKSVWIYWIQKSVWTNWIQKSVRTYWIQKSVWTNWIQRSVWTYWIQKSVWTNWILRSVWIYWIQKYQKNIQHESCIKQHDLWLYHEHLTFVVVIHDEWNRFTNCFQSTYNLYAVAAIVIIIVRNMHKW